MTGDQLKAWRELLKLGKGEAAQALGLARNSYQKYEEGGDIPRYIALACRAVANGLAPWGEDTQRGGASSVRDHVPTDLHAAILSSDEPAARLAKRFDVSVKAITKLRAQNDHVTVKTDGVRLSAETREIVRTSSEPTAILTARHGITRQAISTLRKRSGKS